jgi:hypothetical protein
MPVPSSDWILHELNANRRALHAVQLIRRTTSNLPQRMNMQRSRSTLLGLTLFALQLAPPCQRSALAQSAGAKTEVVVIGTVHEPTASFREETLTGILARVKPDLILLELDPSFFDSTSTLLSQYERVSLETRSAVAYARSAGIKLLPYDIEGRNKFYQQNDYFGREVRLNQEVSRLHAAGQLSPEARALVEALRSTAAVRDACGMERPEVINSVACDVAIEQKQRYAFKGLGEVIRLTPALEEMSAFAALADDFWIRRNEAMARNIVQHVRVLHPKRVVVLAGYEHRYYLRKQLSALATTDGFTLREYRDY